RERIDVDDNFFELGGDSLLATQVVSRIRKVFGVEVPLAMVFQQAGLAGMAEAVEGARGAGGGMGKEIERAERGGGLPLSFAQQRLWFINQLEPGSAAYNVVSALRIQGRRDGAAREKAVEE